MQMKNSFACAVAVAVLLLAFVAAVTAQSNQYPPIPGSTNAMNMGYDRVTGQISHLPVFMFFNNDGLTWKPASNSDVTYAVPDELFVANTDESQELVVQVLTESYEKFLTAYAESFGIDLGISVGALSLGFKFDHSLSNAHMELTDDHAAVGYSHHWYSIYSLTLAPPNLLQLHPWFKAELGQLPPTITTAADQAAYDAFICNFGTDYISWANFGIRVDVQTFVNSTIFDTYSAEWVANQISLTFHYLMFDISPSYFKNQSQIHISDQFLSQARTYVHFIGGNPLYQNNDTLTQWVDSMMYYPHYLNITTIALNTIVPDAQVAATLAQEINAYATSGGHLANPCSTSGITKRAKFPKMRDSSSSSSSGTTATTATTATSKAANANANANDAKVQAKAKAFKPMATGTAAATVNHLFRDAQKAAPTNQGLFEEEDMEEEQQIQRSKANGSSLVEPSQQAAAKPLVSPIKPSHQQQVTSHLVSPAIVTFAGTVKPRPAPEYAFNRAAIAQSTIASAPRMRTFLAPTGLPEYKPPALVETKQSVTLDKDRLYADPALFLGRSFRASWGADGTLIFPSPSITVATVEIRKVVLVQGPADNAAAEQLKSDYIDLLEANLQNSEMSENRAGYSPSFSLSNRDITATLQSYIEATKSAMAANHSTKLVHMHAESVWKLLYALWTLPTGVEYQTEDEYTRNIARRRSLSGWLMESVAPTIKRELDNPQPEELDHHRLLDEIFTHLSGRQIKQAAEKAIQARDLRLATLIAQSNGYSSIHDDIKQQIQIWESVHKTKFDRTLWKIYKLLSGDVSVGSSLDWKRLLGLHLWYNSAPDTQISTVLENFMSTITLIKDASKPYPPYVEDALQKRRGSESEALQRMLAEGKRHFDTCYHVLQLYVNGTHSLAQTLLPLNSTFDLLDYRLSWHLYDILTSGIGFPKSLPLTHQLHTNFIAQLELVGLWEWAIYVAMRLEPTQGRPNVREDTIRELLHRHAAKLYSPDKGVRIIQDDPKLKFLTERLNVPVEWIHEVMAVRAGYERDFRNQVQFLLGCRQYEAAHTVTLRYLAPKMMLNDRRKQLKKILDVLADHTEDLLRWSTRGATFHIYFTAHEYYYNDLQQAKQALSGPLGSQQVQKQLNEEVFIKLSQRLSEWVYESPDTEKQDRLLETVCISEMATFATKGLFDVRELISKINPTEAPMADGALAVGKHLCNLPILPENYRVEQLQNIAMVHL